MKPSDTRKFGSVGLEVTALSFGTAPIGNFFSGIDDSTADEVINRAWDGGIRYFDTAPVYGHGLSEYRLGHSLRWKDRKQYVLSTKVGCVLKPQGRSKIDFDPWINGAAFEKVYDYSYDGTMRSFEDSLQRLGLERIDICFMHHIDRYAQQDRQPQVFEQAMDGCWKALKRLRDEKVIKAIGVGVNEWEVCNEALLRHDFDCFLLAGRYTLLEQQALDEFLPLCVERKVAVVVGGGFNSGILATGAKEGARYDYAPASKEILEKVARIEQVCDEHDVPLPAAAMRFVTAHPAVASFCAGASSARQMDQNLKWFSQPIPSDFWSELKELGLLREDAQVPD